MNSFLVISVLALTVFSLASAASLNFGDNEIPESIEDFKESLKALLRDASEKLKEGANNFEDVEEKNKPLVTVEEEESDAVNDLLTDVNSTGSDNSGISCAWHGLTGVCCKTIYFHVLKFPICVKATIRPHVGIQVSLKIFGRYRWQHLLRNNRTFLVCWNIRHLRVCMIFTNVHVSGSYARMCLIFHARYHHIWANVNLGCMTKHFSVVETADGSPLKLTQAEQNEDIFSIPKENMQTDEIFKFKQ